MHVRLTMPRTGTHHGANSTRRKSKRLSAMSFADINV